MFEGIRIKTYSPAHREIVRHVELGIVSGRLKPGDKLPSARSAAKAFGVDLRTVVKAYRSLKLLRLAYSRPGRGQPRARHAPSKKRVRSL